MFCPDKPREDWTFIRTRVGMHQVVWPNETLKSKSKLHSNGWQWQKHQKLCSCPPKKNFEESFILFRPQSPQVQICNYTLLFVSSMLQYRPVNCALKKKGFWPKVPHYYSHDENVLSCFCIAPSSSLPQWLYAVPHSLALISVSERHHVRPCTSRRLFPVCKAAIIFGTAQCWM